MNDTMTYDYATGYGRDQMTVIITATQKTDNPKTGDRYIFGSFYVLSLWNDSIRRVFFVQGNRICILNQCQDGNRMEMYRIEEYIITCYTVNWGEEKQKGCVLKMELLEAMEQRHSVRSYNDRKIEGEVKEKLQQKIRECNERSGLHIQLVLDEPKAFNGLMAHYGRFSGVANYIAMIGPKSKDLEEKTGYYGEELVLYAQRLGLNTCWVAMTYSKIKGAFRIASGEKLCLVIAIGYGNTNGSAHSSKSEHEVSTAEEPVPEWFRKGVKASLLAPTAMNQQKYKFTLNGNRVSATAGLGFHTKIDLGIVKYHFEAAAGKENFIWE